MKPVTGLFAALAALSVISTVVEAADGCGRGWYFNGRRCVPQEGPPGYGPAASGAARALLRAAGGILRGSRTAWGLLRGSPTAWASVAAWCRQQR